MILLKLLHGRHLIIQVSDGLIARFLSGLFLHLVHHFEIRFENGPPLLIEEDERAVRIILQRIA